MDGWEIVGWAGSALLVYSLLQARVFWFRVLNLVASVVLVGYNAVVGVWPMVGMNAVIAVIDVWFIVQLWSRRHDQRAYTVLEVDPGESYLRHLLTVHAADIARIFPRSRWSRLDDRRRSAFLVLRGDETVGMVLVHDAGDGLAQVEVDYVTPRFRDFTPGEFVYRESGLFRAEGYRAIRTPPGMVDPYYERLGFVADGDAYRLPVGG